MSARERGTGGSEHLRRQAEQEARTAADEVYQAILARAPEHDIDPTLDRVRAVCELLGDPQKAYRTIHLTGTNGKTSTSRMVERLLREHGLRTGRFTSPHLTRVNERIAIDGEPISDERFVEVWQDVAPYVHLVDQGSIEKGEPRLSFFEVFTVMAFAAFADAPDRRRRDRGGPRRHVGLHQRRRRRGRDHHADRDGPRALPRPHAGRDRRRRSPGSSRTARPSSWRSSRGRRGRRCWPSRPSAAPACVREGVDIAVGERQVAVGGQLITLQALGGTYTEIFLPLHGEFQAHNALLALTAVEAFLTGGRGAGRPAWSRSRSPTSTRPGRLEVVRSSPTIIVDGAHNPAGVEALVAAARGGVRASTRLVGVVGVMADKDPEGILAALEPVLAEVVITRASTSRALDAEDLAEIAIDIFGEDRVHAVDRLDDALDLAVARAESEVERGSGVLVTGSILLVAEARRLLGRA